MREFDTIAAVSTGFTESGISIIRVSGNKALSIVSNIFKDIKGRELSTIKPYTMRYGHIYNKENDEIIDEVIVSYMKAPKSYTAEDIVEINCHGGIIVTRTVLEMLITFGARMADPGEFTKRAFLNGRIDLSQAESVMDIITAKTDSSRRSAVNQSEGKLKNKIIKIKEDLLDIVANIEATIDFPEEDIDENINSDIKNRLLKEKDIIENMLKTADEGKVLRDGVSIAIVGKPNVGKSSLMNALLEENRSIVTDIPGTTRDVIEEYLNIKGIPVRLIDTAGIRETEDEVEKIGVERSKKSIDEADLIVLTLDSSRSLDDEDKEIIKYINDKKHLILLNKVDLKPVDEIEKFKKEYSEKIIEVSAKTCEGLENFKDYIVESFFSGKMTIGDIYVTNERQKEALIKAHKYLDGAIMTIDNNFEIDLSSIDIKNALISLGEITGDTVDEDILNRIFTKFCIGK